MKYTCVFLLFLFLRLFKWFKTKMMVKEENQRSGVVSRVHSSEADPNVGAQNLTDFYG